jgi:hypothetical protein
MITFLGQSVEQILGLLAQVSTAAAACSDASRLSRVRA